jgi:hypothetical protein
MLAGMLCASESTAQPNAAPLPWVRIGQEIGDTYRDVSLYLEQAQIGEQALTLQLSFVHVGQYIGENVMLGSLRGCRSESYGPYCVQEDAEPLSTGFPLGEVVHLGAGQKRSLRVVVPRRFAILEARYRIGSSEIVGDVDLREIVQRQARIARQARDAAWLNSRSEAWLRARALRLVSDTVTPSWKYVYALDGVARRRLGAPWLQDNAALGARLDSMRVSFFRQPSAFSARRLAHLDWLAKQQGSASFARKNAFLDSLLRAAEDSLHAQPAAFSAQRRTALDAAAQQVWGRPLARQARLVPADIPLLPLAVVLLLSGFLVYHRGRMKNVGLAYREASNRASKASAEADEIRQVIDRERKEHQDAEKAALKKQRRLEKEVDALRAELNSLRARSAHVGDTNQSGTLSEGFHVPIKSRRAAMQVLGLEGPFNEADLERKYRTMAKAYHPDRVAHLAPEIRALADAYMSQINQAYTFLRRDLAAG